MAGWVRGRLFVCSACVLMLGVVVGFAVWADQPPVNRFDVVVVDAGHGGDDEGARGPTGGREKDVVLAVSNALAKRLRERGLRVVMTRTDDSFVPLEKRTHIANDAKGDLFVSVHANAATNARIRGSETFFLSLDASDEIARKVADRENSAFGEAGAQLPQSSDPLVAILGDLIATEHLTESQEFARLAQSCLAGIDPKVSRGVKQAPFVVLSGVQMPAALVEIGFITNTEDEYTMRSEKGRANVVAALARAVAEFGLRHDARRGVPSLPARGNR